MTVYYAGSSTSTTDPDVDGYELARPNEGFPGTDCSPGLRVWNSVLWSMSGGIPREIVTPRHAEQLGGANPRSAPGLVTIGH